MEKEKIEQRIEDLKKENDKANKTFVDVEQAKQQLIQEVMVRNGRILELQEMLKEE